MMWVAPDMEVTFHATTSFDGVHVILKTITRTRTLKGDGFGLTWCEVVIITPTILTRLWTKCLCQLFLANIPL